MKKVEEGRRKRGRGRRKSGKDGGRKRQGLGGSTKEGRMEQAGHLYTAHND